ncbi:uncharacterized protein LOC141906970 isoform X2 [Tubulanus polymorphus]|uniref:uncharacterized protein LOC141906970 isoform X2 n=1 Tax=Tubulanus polymorphus TaxID=672921 RepID=UPI003DA62AB5
MELLIKFLFLFAVFLYIEKSQVLSDVDSNCHRQTKLQTGTSGVISSPEYPGNYGNDLECIWRIKSPENMKVEISFDPEFNLEPPYESSGKWYCDDYIEINRNVDCDSKAPETRYYSGDVSIKFKSDKSKTYKGFKLFWRIVKVDSTCSKTPRIQTGTSGVISSPDYPGNYGENLNCYWMIRTPENMVVGISFNSNFRIEAKNSGCYDALKIKSGNENIEYCGENAPGRRFYTENITIQFTSDGSKNKAGFKLNWRVLEVKVSVWQVIVYTGRIGTTQTVNIGFSETGSDVMYFHLGTRFEAGSKKTLELLLPGNITNPQPPRQLILKTALTPNWRVIQVALVGVIDGVNAMYMYNCSKSGYTKTKTCKYQSEIRKPGRSTQWQTVVAPITTATSTSHIDENADSVDGFTLWTAVCGVVSEPDVAYECSVVASDRTLGRRTVPPPVPHVPHVSAVGYNEEDENVEDDATNECVYIEDIGEDGTIYARIDNMSRPDPGRFQPSASRGRTVPREILGAEEDVGLYGEIDFNRPAILLTELNNTETGE